MENIFERLFYKLFIFKFKNLTYKLSNLNMTQFKKYPSHHKNLNPQHLI